MSSSSICNVSFPEVSVNDTEELQICSDKLILLNAEVQVYRPTVVDSGFERLHTRLLHVHGRLDRMKPNEQFVELHNKLRNQCLKLIEDLQNTIQLLPSGSMTSNVLDNVNLITLDAENSVSDETTNHAQTLDRSPPVISSSPHVHFSNAVNPSTDWETNPCSPSRRPTFFDSTQLSATTPIARNNLVISKWNLQFNGDSSVTSFLERVEELRVSRGVLKSELYLWDALVTALRHTFLPCDYEESLWDEVRNRTQGFDEPVSIYIAVMENLFRRFSDLPPEPVRLTVIKRNLQPYLQTQLTLQAIFSISELTRVCKVLEDTHIRNSKFKPPPSNIKTVLEPDLAYRRSTAYAPKLAVSSSHRSDDSSFKDSQCTTVGNVITPILCWNCKRSGHVALRCPEPRSKFCYKCGCPNVTVRTCTKCNSSQGNFVRRT
ncbi:hypothetical protein RN001_003154 [Aquatica leii]|uniref:CCHC-type domain-containing protein n=1 Tax=Aquatica leii TaxID=1421715 RepID=A0AAN7PI69_9COLE|nr:hypothetical protein RN001_003154 [Aquatica leii]